MTRFGAQNEDQPCCREVNSFLAEYIDGTIDPAIRARFNAHLRMCAMCRTYLDQYRKTIKLIKTCCSPTELYLSTDGTEMLPRSE